VNSAVTVSEPTALTVKLPRLVIVIAPPVVAVYVNVPAGVPAGLVVGSGEIVDIASPRVFAIEGIQASVGTVFAVAAAIVTELDD
jgi:hypothetical protein